MCLLFSKSCEYPQKILRNLRKFFRIFILLPTWWEDGCVGGCQLEKQNARDKEQMEPLLVKAERLGDMGDRPPREIENFLLDLVAG